MLYAALTFWLLVVVFTAWGVHHIWSGLLKPRTVNLLLLPGTLVAQIGYVMGVLVSGGTLRTGILHTLDKVKPALTTERMFFRLLAGPETHEWV